MAIASPSASGRGSLRRSACPAGLQPATACSFPSTPVLFSHEVHTRTPTLRADAADGPTMRTAPPLPSDLEDAVADLEQEMPQLQFRHLGDMFALANAWAERHDALLARAPDA